MAMRRRSALALLLPALGALLLCFLAPPGRSADKPSPAELKEKVKALVEQLADKDPGKQDEAAVALIQLGPDVLPYLPRPDAKLVESQKKALAVVRKTLRDQQIKRDLTPKLVTIEDELTVSKALAELEKQTGIHVEDQREGTDSKLKLKLNNVTFWQALDAIARDADGHVTYYRGGNIVLDKRPEGYVNPPVSYDGIFRTTIREINIRRLLETDTSVYTAVIEVAWEPRFRPFRLDFNPAELTVEDEKKVKVELPESDKEPKGVTSKAFVLFQIPLGSVQRSSQKLGLLKGNLKFVGPTRMESFAFDKTLAELEKAKDPKSREMSREGVTVKINSLELPRDHWTLVMSVEYPADGPQFESFESWLIFNELQLKNKEGDKTLRSGGGESRSAPGDGGYVIQGAAGNRGTVEYHFIDSPKDKLVRGDPNDWKPVYKVPGLIVEVPASFEFKDVPLP
jgi:hypothetical protein